MFNPIAKILKQSKRNYYIKNGFMVHYTPNNKLFHLIGFNLTKQFKTLTGLKKYVKNI